MSEKRYGNVIMHCGKSFKNVRIEEVHAGNRLCVYKTWGNSQCPTDENGKAKRGQCLHECPCKRKSKRKQDMCYTPEDEELDRRPTGMIVLCRIARVEESEGSNG